MAPDYHGTTLPQMEIDFLLEMESLIQKSPIPKVEVLEKTVVSNGASIVERHTGFTVHKNRITGLGFSNEKLVALPPSLGALSELKELHIINNKLVSLPASLGRLIKLEKLILGNNRLSSLPNSIISLKNLKELDLKSNRMQYLPELFGNLL